MRKRGAESLHEALEMRQTPPMSSKISLPKRGSKRAAAAATANQPKKRAKLAGAAGTAETSKKPAKHTEASDLKALHEVTPPAIASAAAPASASAPAKARPLRVPERKGEAAARRAGRAIKAAAAGSLPIEASASALDARIAERRAMLLAEQGEAHELRARAATLRADAAVHPASRAGIRTQLMKRAEADALEERASRAESGEAVRKFDAAAEAFCATHAPRGEATVRAYETRFEGRAPPVASLQTDFCPTCKEPLRLSADGSMLTCLECGVGRPYADPQAGTGSSSHEGEAEQGQIAKRVSHFQNWMQKFQWKENTVIKQDVIDLVADYCITRGITSEDEITRDMCEDALRHHKLKKVPEHLTQIWCRVTGRPPPRMTALQEETCRRRFLAIQPAFDKHRPPDRKNFLSYPYCLYKFCQLEGWTEFLPCFPILRCAAKLAKTELLWKAICGELGWHFDPVEFEAPTKNKSRSRRARAQASRGSKPRARRTRDDD